MKAGNICSVSFLSESAVKYLDVGRRKIQISPPLGEQDPSNALPQGQQRQTNPHPMPCPRRLNIDRCINSSIEASVSEIFAIKNCYFLALIFVERLKKLSEKIACDVNVGPRWKNAGNSKQCFRVGLAQKLWCFVRPQTAPNAQNGK